MSVLKEASTDTLASGNDEGLGRCSSASSNIPSSTCKNGPCTNPPTYTLLWDHGMSLQYQLLPLTSRRWSPWLFFILESRCYALPPCIHSLSSTCSGDNLFSNEEDRSIQEWGVCVCGGLISLSCFFPFLSGLLPLVWVLLALWDEALTVSRTRQNESEQPGRVRSNTGWLAGTQVCLELDGNCSLWNSKWGVGKCPYTRGLNRLLERGSIND